MMDHRSKKTPTHIAAQIAGPVSRDERTPVDGTPITQLSHRVRQANDTANDTLARVHRLESQHTELSREIGSVKVSVASIDGKLDALIDDAEKARAARADRQRRIDTLAENAKERLTRKQVAWIAIFGPIVAAVVTALVTVLVMVLR